MGHIVVFEGTEGVAAFHRCEELGDAVSFVEKLRNDRGVESVQIYRTEEIVFDFKPYYRVEIGALGAGSSPAGALSTPSSAVTSSASTMPPPSTMVAPPPITTMAAPDRVPVEGDDFDDERDEEDLSGAGARRGLFGR